MIQVSGYALNDSDVFECQSGIGWKRYVHAAVGELHFRTANGGVVLPHADGTVKHQNRVQFGERAGEAENSTFQGVARQDVDGVRVITTHLIIFLNR